ncbi:hypothetical protein LOK49_LG03G02694 [Camellia lanceoleosa]|uniref:Uncharacterized protein n=1 Tax=Camellia lanceoleosa TaxID=1840588 RepID=A0ACC0IFC3_9ERIC|nr:hypothetical protein LOK49_LG03G02694 [Camellia lanceoleosa]
MLLGGSSFSVSPVVAVSSSSPLAYSSLFYIHVFFLSSAGFQSRLSSLLLLLHIVFSLSWVPAQVEGRFCYLEMGKLRNVDCQVFLKQNGRIYKLEMSSGGA